AKPGQRRPLQRPAGTPARPSTSLTDAELARAAELEAGILAQEKAAEDARRARDRTRRPTGGEAVAVGYSAVPLSVRAADEYAYVKRDIRRITIVGGFLI